MTMSEDTSKDSDGLRGLDDLADDAIGVVYNFAEVGIQFIDTQANDPHLLRKLRLIFMDIRKELTKEEELSENRILYHCYQCATKFRYDPIGYADCMNQCIYP